MFEAVFDIRASAEAREQISFGSRRTIVDRLYRDTDIIGNFTFIELRDLVDERFN